MTETTDPYRMLRVKPDASASTIRAAYRMLAWEHHPDVGGSERTMAALNEAWRVLRDPVARARYDARRSAVPMGKGPGKPTGARPPGDQGPSVGAAARDDRPASTAAAPARSASSAEPVTRAPGRGRADESPALDFGRYEGWSLVQLATTDPDYLEWLARTSIGRRFQPQIAALLAARRAAMAPQPDATRASARPAGRWGRPRAAAAR